MNEINTSLHWQHWLTRAFSLFSSSLYSHWYSSEGAKVLFNSTIQDILLIEEHPNLTRIYRDREQLNAFHSALEEIITSQSLRTKEILNEGVQLYAKAENFLAENNSFPDFQSAYQFYLKYSAQAIIFTFFTHKVFEGKKQLTGEQEECVRVCERLRRKPLYEALAQKILLPLAQKHLKKNGYPEMDVSLLSVQEVLGGISQSIYEDRREAQKQGKRFVYQNVEGNESIIFCDPFSLELLIGSIDSDYVGTQEVQEVRGTTAFPGKVQGRVRLILDTNPHVEFAQGSVLVSINSDPGLMPLINKSAALVTDEGGMTCHAAIVSRELKIPCVIGTKKATRIFKDGDLVEVDAEKGIVKKIF